MRVVQPVAARAGTLPLHTMVATALPPADRHDPRPWSPSSSKAASRPAADHLNRRLQHSPVYVHRRPSRAIGSCCSSSNGDDPGPWLCVATTDSEPDGRWQTPGRWRGPDPQPSASLGWRRRRAARRLAISHAEADWGCGGTAGSIQQPLPRPGFAVLQAVAPKPCSAVGANRRRRSYGRRSPCFEHRQRC